MGSPLFLPLNLLSSCFLLLPLASSLLLLQVSGGFKFQAIAMSNGSGWKPVLWVTVGKCVAFAYGPDHALNAGWKPVPLSNEEWAVSLDLNREFSNSTNFSVRNLWYMKQWYLFYTQGGDTILKQLGAELQKIENQYTTKMHQVGAELNSEKLHQVGGEFILSHTSALLYCLWVESQTIWTRVRQQVELLRECCGWIVEDRRWKPNNRLARLLWYE